ncbi:MAG: hypothetical protein M1453_11205 [Acidobacteria bacterium]|nr:hypothetical protein [Acidobacteriota bacterium]
MEKKILQYSYWLGVLCVVVAVIWRFANAMGYGMRQIMPGQSIYYMSFYKAALLFLMVSIATGANILAGKDKP